MLTMVSKTSKIKGGAEHSKFSATNVWRPYKSPAAYARTALRAYRDGIALTERDRNGEKVETSLRGTEGILAHPSRGMRELCRKKSDSRTVWMRHISTHSSICFYGCLLQMDMSLK